MHNWADIRYRVLKLGVSKRAILRATRPHHSTLKRILEHPRPPGYQTATPRPAPKLGPHVEWIKAVLQTDRSVHHKQRHTARRIFHRLRDERGYTGGRNGRQRPRPRAPAHHRRSLHAPRPAPGRSPG